MKRGSSGNKAGRMKTKYNPRPINMTPWETRKIEGGESFAFTETPMLELLGKTISPDQNN